MKKICLFAALLLIAAAASACTVSQADDPLYTVRTTETTKSTANPSTVSEAPISTDASGSTTSNDAPAISEDVPVTDGTSLPPSTQTTQAPPVIDPATTPAPVTTAAPPETDAPIPSDAIVVNVTPEVVNPGKTYTGRDPLPAISLTVKDPNNTAGLETLRIDYSFGVAANGQPNVVSVNHQAYFDSHNRAALTLDNISTDAGKKVLYLTFDNGYEYNDLTGDILDTLKEKNVPATFFCTLDYLEDNPNYVVRMINEGHIVGNHSTTHPVMTDLNKVEMAEELLGVENYLRVNYGYSSKYFRFPSGTYNDMALELVDSLGFRAAFWSNAHSDWDTTNQPSVQKTFDTVTSRLHPGSVILLHAVSQSNADALADIIDYARSEGYVFRSLDDYQGW